jgi:RNA polymerase sigma factor (sigma-70 family)
MRPSLWAPFFAYSPCATSRTPSRFPMDALAECRPQVESLVARILRRAKDDPDVQDCTNDALRRVIEQKERLREGAAFEPWVLGVARHVALDSLRAEYRRRARTASPRADHGGDDPLSLLPSHDPSPETLVVERQRMQTLDDAMQSLPIHQKDALLLLHVQGLGYREIATRLGVPIGTVGTWVLRGREALAQAFERAEGTVAAGRSGFVQKEKP